ncbi:TlpA family protein disulfide reductase [Spongiimicrobium sp. 2-473A-2-J]|uniref:TlpA family protein disulfide reductase n=1 Tax=Eudoraea algarum TaxID=3417568 RepID=UPI003D368CFD
MNKILFYLVLFLLASCGEGKNECPTVYFAGEIVNPTSSHVVLYKDDMVIDSAKLDENSRFSFLLDSVDEGLYHFYHEPEVQYIFLERGDSLQIRLNTIDFDESLIFSGTGEEINNFLLEIFLSNELEEESIASYYWLDPLEFSEKLDSLRNQKITLLESLMEEVTLTEAQVDMARASIDFSYYIYKEKYPFYHKKRTGEMGMDEFPCDFYAYRKSLDFDNRNLTYFRPYYNFMKYHFGNMSYMSCAENCGIDLHSIKNHLHFTKHTMALIDSMVTQKELRDNLFRNVAMDYLLKVNDTEENNKAFIDHFHELSGNNKHIDEITDLYAGIRSMQPDRELPDVKVLDSAGNHISIRDIAKDKDVVFYFWWGTQKGHFRNMTKQVAKLSIKHPDKTFVGINLDTDPLRWISILETSNLDKSKQFRSDNTSELRRALIVDHLNKGVITKDGRIANAFANMYTTFQQKDSPQ